MPPKMEIRIALAPRGGRTARVSGSKEPVARSSVILLGIFLAGSLLSACAPKGEALLSRAEQSLATGEYQAAMIDLRNYVSDNPSDPRARAMLGRAMLELGDSRAAEVEVRKAKELGASRELTIVAECRLLIEQDEFDRVLDECTPSGDAALDAELAVARGDAFLGQQKFSEARSEFESALRIDPSSLNATQGLAAAAFGAEGIAAARDVFQAAPEDVRGRARFWLAQGSLEMRSGNFPEAEVAYARAVETVEEDDNRGRLSALAGLTEAQMRQGKTDEADATSRSLLEAAPKSPYAKLLRAQAAASAGDLQTARRLLEEIVSSNPENLQARTVLGAVNLQQGNYGQAEMHLASVVANQPDNLQAQRLLAQVRNEVQSPGETLEALKPSLQKTSTDPGLLTLASRLSLQSGDTEQALGYLAKAAESAAQKSPQAQLEVAGAYLAAGDVDRAIEVLESMPEDERATGIQRETLLLTALLRQGRTEDAVARAESLATQSPQDATARTVAGAVFAATGRTAEARSEFEEVLKLKPGDAATHLNIARLDIREGDMTAASEQLQAALETDSDNLAATLGMAAVAQSKNDAAAAERWLTKAAQEHPDSAQASLALVQFYLMGRDFGTAGAQAEGIVERAPENAVAWNMLGLARLGTGELAGARDAFNSAVERSPRTLSYRLNLARVHALQREPDEALRVIDEAIAEFPDGMSAVALGAGVALQSGDTARAAGYIERMRKAAPNAAATMRLEGDLAFAQKRYKNASDHYAKAAAAGTDRRLTIAQYRARTLGKVAQPQAPLVAWLEENPDDAPVRVLLAEYLASAGKQTAANSEYERALKSDPGNFVALNNLAVLYQQQGDERGLAMAERAHAIAPDNAAVQDTYGWALVKSGRPAEGLKPLRDAAGAMPDSPEVQYHLAIALARTGETETASQLLRQVIASTGPADLKADAKRALAEISQ